MISRRFLELLKCPACGGETLSIGAGRRPNLVCEACEANYPIVDGIVDMMAPQRSIQPGQYRTETLFDIIAGVYDVVAPVMSVGIWHCSPLRYVDQENRAVGRANGGVLLKAPIATGIVIDKVLAPYHDVAVVGVDTSWKMLRKAQARLERHGHPFLLLRAEQHRLPLRTGSVDGVQSVNGLHTFSERQGAVVEWLRVAKPGSNISGSTLIRGQEGTADAALDQFEQYGVYPMLRSGRFIVEELRAAGVTDVHHESYGAVMFFTGTAQLQRSKQSA
ncbi:MAG: methyltransferase domain-containing protein [bacterium]